MGGKLDCGATCMKYILFVINFVFFLSGLAASALGIWALVDKNKMNVLSKVGAANSNAIGLLEAAAIALLVCGLIILAIGFLGCCGAMRLSQCLLCTYAVVLGVILFAQIAVVGIAIAFNSKVQGKLKSLLKTQINDTYEWKVNSNNAFSLGLDYAQVFFHCCGIESYTEFKGAKKWNVTAVVPPTCCKLKNEKNFFKDQSKVELMDISCPSYPTAKNSYVNQPCWNSIKSYLKSKITVVIGIAVGLFALEIGCFVFTICIINDVKREGYSDI